MRKRSSLKSEAVRRIRLILFFETLLVVGSVVAAYLLQWRIPLPVWLAVPAGLLLWLGGLMFTLNRRRRWMAQNGVRSRRGGRNGYPLVKARGIMHLGVALGFRSWPTLALAAVLFALNLILAMRTRRLMPERPWRRRDTSPVNP